MMKKEKAKAPVSTREQAIDDACKALAASSSWHRKDEDEDKQDAVVDLLTNLMHYCAEHNWEFDDLVETANDHFQEEN